MTAGSAGIVTDGITVADLLAGDTGQNAQIVAGSRKEAAFNLVAAGASSSVDVGNYRWVAVQVTAVYVGMTSLTFQISNDNATWSSAALLNVSSTSAAASTSTTAVSLYHGSLSGRYFRVLAAGTQSSGTTTVQLLFSAVPAALQTFGGTTIPSLAPTATTGSATGNINTIRVTGSGTAASTQLVAAPGSGLSIYVTELYAANSGASATLMALLPNGGTAVHDFMVPVGLNTERSFKTPWKLAANTALNYTVGTATTSWFLTCHYYVAA